DTQPNWVSIGADSRILGAIAGNSGDQTITGPTSWWVAQQLLLRPIYDTSLAQATSDGTKAYDALNRLTSSGNAYTYTYDGASNRLRQTLGTQVLDYNY